MWSRRKSGWCLAAVLLLMAGVVRPLREVLVYPVVRHARALVSGRPLQGFPPEQLTGYAAALARQELDTWTARMAAGDPGERKRLDDRLEALRVQMAQVQQERVWYQVAHHPLESAGVLLFVLGLVCGLRWWALSPEAGRVAPAVLPSGRPRVESGRIRRNRDAVEDEGGDAEGAGGEVLDVPLEHEIERLLATGEESDSDQLVEQAPDPDWDGWSQAVRERMPPLEMAHLIALFASDPSRNYLGLLGFLSHQLALSGSEHIRLFPGRKGVQIFLSTPDREQEIGELPPQQYAGLVVALTNALNLQPDGPSGRASRWARLVAPSGQGYQVQEVRLYDNAIEIRAGEHVRFLPAGW